MAKEDDAEAAEAEKHQLRSTSNLQIIYLFILYCFIACLIIHSITPLCRIQEQAKCPGRRRLQLLLLSALASSMTQAELFTAPRVVSTWGPETFGIFWKTTETH